MDREFSLSELKKLNSNKGLNESIVDDYIYECITIYENTINKIKNSTLVDLSKILHVLVLFTPEQETFK